MKFLAIILACTALAVGYGILHDLVTAHVCVEYFTIAHPTVIPSENPVALALIWGVIATWWVGFSLGFGLALASRSGSRPTLDLRDLVPDLAKLFRTMAAVALLSGAIGYTIASLKWVFLVPPLSAEITQDRWPRFFFAAFAHNTSYLIGFLGGLRLIVVSYRRRAL